MIISVQLRIAFFFLFGLSRALLSSTCFDQSEKAAGISAGTFFNDFNILNSTFNYLNESYLPA